MSNEIKCTIHDDASVTVTKGGVTKRISVEDYVKLLSMLAQDVTPATAPPYRLPAGSLHSMVKTSVGYVLNMYFEGREATLRYRNADWPAYIPNVMMRVELSALDGSQKLFSVANVHWFATDRSRGSLPAEWGIAEDRGNNIWILPFPNMFNDARMCMGSNSGVNTVRTDWSILNSLYEDVFLRSQFNDDLSPKSWRDTIDTEEFFVNMKSYVEGDEYTEFPYDLLR